jgi:hypothetical protein
MPDLKCAMTAMSTDGNAGEMLKGYSRRDFFTSGSKDMLKDVMRAWQNFSEEKMKEETKLSCEEAARKVFSRRNIGKNSLLKKVINK